MTVSERAFQAAERDGYRGSAALRLLDAAFRGVECSSPQLARTEASQTLAHAATANIQIIAALVLARAGDTVTAGRLADGLERQYPRGTMFNGYWLPTIRGAIELSENSPVKAIQSLEDAAQIAESRIEGRIGNGEPAYRKPSRSSLIESSVLTEVCPTGEGLRKARASKRK